MAETNTAIAILLISFVIMLFARFPVAIALVGCSALTMAYLDLPPAVIGQQMLQGTTVYAMLAIPFFVLAGQLLGEGGLANRIVAFVLLLVGRIRGGLGLVSNVACFFFGALSSSAVADVSAIGSVMIPMMKKQGYDADYATGLTVASAIQAVIVPPSHNLIIYSIAVGGSVSISALFVAGIVPGIMMMTMIMIAAYILASKRGYPKGEPIPRQEWGKIIMHGLFSLTPAVIILGSIVSGWATATEAGAIAVLYCFILAFVFYREAPLSTLYPIFLNTFRTTLMVFFLIGASRVFGWLMSFLKAPDMITSFFLNISSDPFVVLLLINILLLLLGCFMDMAPLILITAPILLPVCVNFGMDPVQFGIMLILNLGLGLITPPVGTVLFAGCAIGEVSVLEGGKAMLPFFCALLVVLAIVTYVPSATLWLPSVLGR
jgi:tripartite ATP-independent transporter DctM subunit